MQVKDIYDFLDSIAPYGTQCPWDNSGIAVGAEGDSLTSVMVALDCTRSVVAQAAAKGCSLIVAHHPPIFEPLKRLESSTAVYDAAARGIAVISAHTNLDMSDGGVNDTLAQRLMLRDVRELYADGAPILRVGETDFSCAADFAAFISRQLGGAVNFCDNGKRVSKVALCSGSGGEYVRAAKNAGCDSFVTGEAHHHILLEAGDLGVSLFVAGHFETERPVVYTLAEALKKAFPALEVFTAEEEAPYRTVINSGT